MIIGNYIYVVPVVVKTLRETIYSNRHLKNEAIIHIQDYTDLEAT